MSTPRPNPPNPSITIPTGMMPRPQTQQSAPSLTQFATIDNNNHQADNEDELDANNIINMDTFEQLLEMDDGDTFEFIKSLVDTFHDQAISTFADMDTKLKVKDLEALSRLGHFLKGSSASVGLLKVPITCGHIQNYGQLKDEKGEQNLTPDQALTLVTDAMYQLKREYAEADRFFKEFFEPSPEDDNDLSNSP
ncbi:Phosphorelay intermediate protein [Dispira simplex]|nr:Phosphorelay intermediate protein [Dispira simplex]